MQCECEKEMVVTEDYNRGRRQVEVYTCFDCTINLIKKGRKLGNNTGRGIKARGCSVPWGKEKHTRFPTKKKDKPKKRRGY